MRVVLVRVVRPARRHRIGNAHILAAMGNAGEPVVVATELGPQLRYVAQDDRGVELHVIAVPDDRREGGVAVIHAMPTSYSRSTDDRDETKQNPNSADRDAREDPMDGIGFTGEQEGDP